MISVAGIKFKMKKLLCVATIVTSITLINTSLPAKATSTRTVYAEDIESTDISLKIWRGYGLTINFQGTGETIKQVWLGDMTRFSITSNGNLCSKNQSDCEGSPATVLFLRQIKPIQFPNMTSSADGATQITILTDQKQYQFKLIAASGQPQYTSLMIKPQSEKPLPLPLASSNVTTATTTIKKTSPSNSVPAVTTPAPTPARTPTPRPAPRSQEVVTNKSTSPIGTSIQRDDANALAYGLAQARQQGQIKFNSLTWRKVQTAIKLLRQGKDRKTVIAVSGVNADLFNQLLLAGKR